MIFVDTILQFLTSFAEQAPAPFGTGLTGEYFNNIDFTDLRVTRIDPVIDFNWGFGSPDPAVGPDTFSVRWVGILQTPFSETYTFHTTSDDGIRLWVNDTLVVNDWSDHAARERSGSIKLDAGLYDIKVEYYENTRRAVAKLAWSSPSQPKQIIPQSYLYPRFVNEPD